MREEHAVVEITGALGAGYEAVVRASNLPSAELTRDGTIAFTNQALGDLVDRDASELLGQPFASLADAADQPRLATWLTAATTGERVGGRIAFVGDRGRRTPVQVAFVPVDIDGHLVAIHTRIVRLPGEGGGLVRARLEELFHTSPIGLSIADLEGRFEVVNPALCRLLGRDQDDLLGRTFWDITHPDDREDTHELWSRTIRNEQSSYALDKRYLHADGTAVPVRVTVTATRDEQGAPRGSVATVEDLRTRTREELEHASARSLPRLAGRIARFAGWELEVATGRARWTEELHRILETDHLALDLTDGLERFYEGEHRDRVAAAIQACVADGTPFDIEVQATTGTGRTIWARVTGEPERAADGSIQRVVGAYQDVSDLRTAHEEIVAGAARLRDAWESTSDGVLLLDPDGRTLFVNRRGAELMQVPRDRLLGAVVWELLPQAVDDGFLELYRAVLDHGEPAHVEEVRVAALDAWFQVNAYPTAEGVAVYFRDVTSKRATREQIAERERRLAEQAALLDEAQDAIHVRDLDGTVTYWNRGAERLFGWTAQEAVGRHISEVTAALGDAAVAAVRTAHERGAWSGELRVRHRDGSERTVETRLTLLRDDDGSPRSLLSIETDVTARRRAEQQLLRAQRLESIGTLAGGIAHDLNNVLAPIVLAVELLADDEPDEHRAELLATVQAAAERGADMVRQVLSFARGLDGARGPVDVRALLDDVLRIAGETVPPSIALRRDIADDLPAVEGDVTQLHQLLMNLVVNARDALARGGTLRVRAGVVDLDATYVAPQPDLTPGRHVRIEVEDDGPGISAEVIERIFEPFFTTKPTGEGTGLGLSTSLAIAESHGGTLQVASEPGRGTAFRLLLPALDQGAATAVDVDDVGGPLPQGRGELVLVVDDEDAVRRTTRETLAAAGYRVLVANDGAQAVEVAVAHLEDLELVLTDVTMPVMDGAATVHALRRLAPQLPVIAASGLHTTDRSSPIVAAGVQRLLPKPYGAEALLVAVREVLDERAPR